MVQLCAFSCICLITFHRILCLAVSGIVYGAPTGALQAWCLQCSSSAFARAANKFSEMAANQSLLVETSEEDSFLAVVRHIADLLNEGQVRKPTSALQRLPVLTHALLRQRLASAGSSRVRV